MPPILYSFQQSLHHQIPFVLATGEAAQSRRGPGQDLQGAAAGRRRRGRGAGRGPGRAAGGRVREPAPSHAAWRPAARRRPGPSRVQDTAAAARPSQSSYRAARARSRPFQPLLVSGTRTRVTAKLTSSLRRGHVHPAHGPLLPPLDTSKWTRPHPGSESGACGSRDVQGVVLKKPLFPPQISQDQSCKKMDSEVQRDGRILDLIDDAWREDKLPYEDVAIPLNELPEPEQDNGGTTESVKEQEMKWTDLALQYLHENGPPIGN